MNNYSCLSVRQPWAWLIIQGYKNIENRSQRCHIQKTIALHASTTNTRNEYAAALALIADRGLDITLPPIEDLVTGAIVGLVDIVDCVTQSDSPWFTGEYGWVLANPRSGIPVPQRGQQGFFPVEYEFSPPPIVQRFIEPPSRPHRITDELKVGDVLQFPTSGIKKIVEIDCIKQEAIVVRLDLKGEGFKAEDKSIRYPIDTLKAQCDRVPPNVVPRVTREGQTSMKDWLNGTQERRRINTIIPQS
jgi:hypothetical protein